MDILEEVKEILYKASKSGEYHNPHEVSVLMDLLEDYRDFDDEELNMWAGSLWEY